jgi:hypothetical protein
VTGKGWRSAYAIDSHWPHDYSVWFLFLC